MIQTNKLFIIVLTLCNLGLLAPVKAVDPSDTFYGNGAGNPTTTGVVESGFGYAALQSVTTGSGNTASGGFALYSNTIGNDNTASGAYALYSSTTGNYNTASGAYSLYSNTTGNYNTASGAYALHANQTGGFNTAYGYQALYNTTTGHANVALGYFAGINITLGSGNIEIGNSGTDTDVDTTRIGTRQSRCFIAGIYNTVLTSNVPMPVYIDSAGQLGAKGSSQRFKHEIKPMDTVSEAILSLRPVTFHYKGDQTNTAEFGLIAEEVEKVNPDLVVRDKDGQIYSVRYEAVNAMLLNEFLKEHKAFVEEQRKVEEQGAKIGQLEKQIQTLTVGLQKVSAQLAVTKPSPQTVRNP